MSDVGFRTAIAVGPRQRRLPTSVLDRGYRQLLDFGPLSLLDRGFASCWIWDVAEERQRRLPTSESGRFLGPASRRYLGCRMSDFGPLSLSDRGNGGFRLPSRAVF